MKYYGQVVKRKLTKKEIKKKREDALRYKHEHYAKYLKNNQKRSQILRKSINEFLLSKLDLR